MAHHGARAAMSCMIRLEFLAKHDKPPKEGQTSLVEEGIAVSWCWKNCPSLLPLTFHSTCHPWSRVSTELLGDCQSGTELGEWLNGQSTTRSSPSEGSSQLHEEIHSFESYDQPTSRRFCVVRTLGLVHPKNLGPCTAVLIFANTIDQLISEPELCYFVLAGYLFFTCSTSSQDPSFFQ